MKRNAFRPWSAAAVIASILMAALPSGCSSHGAADDAGAPAALAVLEPIPAPPGLLAEITIPAPEATWKEARVAVGGPALFLPQSIGGFVTSVLGLPITAAGEFDGNLPALGAIIDAPERPQPYVSIGVHVRVGGRLVDQLTKGESPRFTSRVDTASGVTMIEPKGNVKSPVAMGVLGNYFLVGREAADLFAAGPYIARTLAKSPAQAKEDVAIDIPDAALVGPVKQGLSKIREALNGSKAVTVPLFPLDQMSDKLLAVVPDLAKARLTVDLDGPTLRLRLAGTPRPGGGPASIAIREMKAGDVAPLRSMPADTLLACLDRASTAVFGESATPDAESPLPGPLGKLGKEDREAVSAAFRAITAARGPYTAFGISFGSTGPLGYTRAPSRSPDDEALGKAMKDLVALLKRPSIKAWLTEQGYAIKVGKGVVEGVSGDVQRLTVSRVDDGEKDGGKGAKGATGKGGTEKPKAAGPGAKDAAKDGKDQSGAKDAKDAKDGKDQSGAKDAKSELPGELPTSIDIFYLVRKDGLFAAAGYGAKEGFSNFLRASDAPSGGFDSVPEIKAALDGLTGDVAFTLIADPLRFIASRAGKPGAAPSAPVVIALGRASGGVPEEIWLRLDVAVVAIQELVKNRGALSL